MIVENGTRKEFKRCLLAALPEVPQVDKWYWVSGVRNLGRFPARWMKVEAVDRIAVKMISVSGRVHFTLTTKEFLNLARLGVINSTKHDRRIRRTPRF